jgi:hypothetical protein
MISDGDGRISLRCSLGAEAVAVSGVGELGALCGGPMTSGKNRIRFLFAFWSI